MIQVLRKLQQKTFEGANKPGKYLAYQFKKKKERRLITKLIGDQEEVNESEIKNMFLKYYSNLHKQELINPEILQAYIQTVELNQLTEQEREDLNKPITKEEIQEAISLIKTGKAPGPDGYTLKFYRVFQVELIPKLQTVVNNILDGKPPPRTWQEARISLIPKTEQNKPNVKDFRPISLLNTDYKIFSKIIAERMQKILSKYIIKDQAVFLPNRNIRDNLRTVIYLIEYGEMTPGKKLGFFFLDAEKAFDNINWQFIKRIFEKLKMRERIQKALNNIYSNQTAALIVNNETTGNFAIQKGTRQGCPLSLLLFVLILEVLLHGIQGDDQIQGLKL